MVLIKIGLSAFDYVIFGNFREIWKKKFHADPEIVWKKKNRLADKSIVNEGDCQKAPSWPFNLQLFAQPLSICLYQILLYGDYTTFPT